MTNRDSVRSMTGYGTARVDHSRGEIVAELWSLNHRYFDFSFSGPESYGSWEVPLKKAVAKRIPRGRVRLSIRFAGSSATGERLALSDECAQEYLQFYRTLKARYNLRGDLKAEDLLMAPQVVVPRIEEPDRDATLAVVLRAVSGGLDRLVEMQLAEGAVLCADLDQRYAQLARIVGRIREKGPAQVESHRQSLEARIRELKIDGLVGAERIGAEVALFADRIDITEETVRLESHLAQCRSALTAGGEVGHRLDFLAQELNREINTIGSKAQSIEISTLVVEFKEELSRVREQLQNII